MEATEAKRVLDRARRDPVWFIENVLGGFLWSKQREVAESVRDHRRTSVRSCHGVGKTYVASGVAVWFLFSFPNSRVVTTATTFSQVEKLLWHEINQRHMKARFPLGGRCLKTELQLDDGRYAIGLSSKPENSEAFAGHHAENLLVIYDEASGIPSPIYEAGEGYMTSEGAKLLMIGNPTRPDGQFYKSHHSERQSYNTIHISAFDSPNFTGEKVPEEVARHLIGPTWVEEKRKAWGEESPLYQVRVLGNFPAEAENAVISLLACESAQQRDYEPTDRDEVVIGCDVARFGTDETVIDIRKGNRVRRHIQYVGKNLMETVGHLVDAHKQHGGRIVVDDTGVGGGVTDRCRELGLPVTGFNGGEQALEPDNYPNRRSELWFLGADRMSDLDIDPSDDQLLADLVAPTYRLDSRGRRVVEPKAETKKRLGRSPDRGDALLLTLVPEGSGIWTEVW